MIRISSVAPGGAATSRPGRPRDRAIDDRVIEVTLRHLARHGYEAMSMAAIAAEARTSRPALYRRWSTKADLATAAIATLAAAGRPRPTQDPWSDLIADLETFRRGVSRPDGVSMVGTMLVGSTDPELVALYRARVVAPRRASLRATLERARSEGLIDVDADVDLALSMLTGSWYGAALVGGPPPRHWARRVAAVVWRGLGGMPPP